MEPITVLIADDHEILRYGLSTYLSDAKDIEVIGEASSGTECLELFKKTKPDICLLDISMPGKNGIETTKSIHELNPDAKILILSMHVDEQILRELLSAGINGYLLKDTDKADLLNGIRSIIKGHQVFSDPISDMMKSSFLGSEDEAKKLHKDITNRELEILKLIAKGLTSKEIAEKLYISPRTVDTHRANLMNKLELDNIVELVRFALDKNLIS